VQCDLSSYDRSGTIIAFDRKEVTSTGPSTLTLQVSQSVFRGAYSLSCSLPAGGELINYTVAEPTSTDTD
jgi:hypothetical protein